MATPAFDAATAPLIIVQNAGAGQSDAAAQRARVAQLLTAAGRTHRFMLAEQGRALPRRAARAVAIAQAEGGAVVAVGGDGTQHAVANAALGRCVMGVLPQGTFNYFARAQGIPTELDDAVRVLLTGRVQPVQVGLVNDQVFVVNASLGLYPQLLEDREAWKARLGRSRLVAMGAGAATLLGLHRPMRMRVASVRGEADVRALTLFVGNNALQCEQLGLEGAQTVGRGQLAGLVLKPVGWWRMLGLMARGALGTLGESDDVISALFDAADVQPGRAGRRVKVAMDGEVQRMQTPLRFSISPQPLSLLVPGP